MNPDTGKEPVKTPLSDEKAKGLTGRIGCAGCGKSNGTLVGTKFFCNTSGCKYEVKVPASPWTRGT